MKVLHSLSLAFSLLTPLTTAHIPPNITALPVVAPGLDFLYTMLVECDDSLYRMPVPYGTRAAIPIVGGEFTGPRLKGHVLNLGADWGLTDPRTGIFSPDTRYQLQTDDGAFIYIRTSGSAQPGGELHLRVLFETGYTKYYWLNNVVGESFFLFGGGVSFVG